MQSVLTSPLGDSDACQSLEPLIMDKVLRGGFMA